jgi:hypothetical protein
MGNNDALNALGQIAVDSDTSDPIAFYTKAFQSFWMGPQWLV